MRCPKCGAGAFVVMYPSQGNEPYGTALATCTRQRACDWKTGPVPMVGEWEIDIEWRVRAYRVLHGTTVATAIERR